MLANGDPEERSYLYWDHARAHELDNMIVNSQDLRDVDFTIIKHVPELRSERVEALDKARAAAEAARRVRQLEFADDGSRHALGAPRCHRGRHPRNLLLSYPRLVRGRERLVIK